MVFKTNNKNGGRLATTIKSVVNLLCFLFLCSFANLSVAQNNFEGLYIKGEVEIYGSQFIYQKESETLKTANKTTFYIAENTLVSGLNTANNIQIIILKENKLEGLVSNQVPEKAKGIKTKSRTTFKNQIATLPYGNAPFNYNNSLSLYAIAFSSTYKKKKSSLQKTISVTNVSLFNKAEMALPKETLNYCFLKENLYNLQPKSQYVTRPPPTV